jgi:hypothetical protein
MEVSFVIYLQQLVHVQCSFQVVRIGCVYVNCADCAHYKLLFDKVQKAVQSLTNCPLQFKHLSKGGNMLAFNVDLEAPHTVKAICGNFCHKNVNTTILTCDMVNF